MSDDNQWRSGSIKQRFVSQLQSTKEERDRLAAELERVTQWKDSYNREWGETIAELEQCKRERDAAKARVAELEALVRRIEKRVDYYFGPRGIASALGTDLDIDVHAALAKGERHD